MKDTVQRHEAALPSVPALHEAREGGGQLSAQLASSPRQLAQRRLIRQTLGSAVQRVEGELGQEDDPAAAQLLAEPAQLQENRTGLPDGLKSGIESLSGMDMSDVRVHRNSGQPAQLNALAYAQGNDIHLGPGQEQHLPHEAWHVVQQRQGRAQATTQMAGVEVNDDEELEKEADAMGEQAKQLRGEVAEQARFDSGLSDAQTMARGAGNAQRKKAFKDTAAVNQLAWDALWLQIGSYFDKSVKEWFDIGAKTTMPVPTATEFGHGSKRKGGGSKRAKARFTTLQGEIWHEARMDSEMPDKKALAQLKSVHGGSVPDVDVHAGNVLAAGVRQQSSTMQTAQLQRLTRVAMGARGASLAGALGGHGTHGAHKASTPASVGRQPVQRMSVQKSYGRANGLAGEHAPFQLATIQFEASYDLTLYRVHILAYLAETPAELTPVIELRAYDTATPLAVEGYLDLAAATIKSWDGVERPFIVRYKTLRDETIDPHQNPGEDLHGETATLEQINALQELALGEEKLPAFIDHSPDLARPKAKLQAGDLMLAAPEFHELSAMGDAALRGIWMGQSVQKHSLHVRLLAKMILQARTGVEQQPSSSEPVATSNQSASERQQVQRPPTRLRRSNSTTTPAALTITNLVAGNEDTTRGVVLAAVQAAFEKGTAVVLLTIEHRGTGDSPWHRISNQIDALRRARFRVETIQTIDEGTGDKAQQSGVRKDEPTPTAPARSVLKISRETRPQLPDDVAGYIALHRLEGAYLAWYAAMVHQDTDEAMDTISVTGAQFLRETRGLI